MAPTFQPPFRSHLNSLPCAGKVVSPVHPAQGLVITGLNSIFHYHHWRADDPLPLRLSLNLLVRHNFPVPILKYFSLSKISNEIQFFLVHAIRSRAYDYAHH